MADKFLFLYPSETNIDSPNFVGSKSRREVYANENGFSTWIEFYVSMLNKAINERYRKNGFSIGFTKLSDVNLVEGLDLREQDLVIDVGMDLETHTTKIDGEFPYYPDNQFILNQILPVDRLVVSGFHVWSCVEKLAKYSYEKCIDVLVDEDLTEFFPNLFLENGFVFDSHPSYNTTERDKVENRTARELFLDARRDKPWLWMEYPNKAKFL